MIGSLITLAGELAMVVWLVSAVFWAVASTALGSWLGRPWWQGALLGAVLVPLGPVVLLTMAGFARSRRKAQGLPHPGGTPVAWNSHLPRWLLASGAVLMAAVLVWVTGLPDTRLGFGDRRTMDLAIRDVGLTAVTLASVIALAAAAAVTIWRPTRWAAVAVSWCGAWWLLWSLAALLIGDTLRVLVASARATTAVPLVVRVGVSWSLLFALSVLLVAWSAALLLVTLRGGPARPERMPPARWVGGAHAAPAAMPASRPASSPALPAPQSVSLAGAEPFADPFADGWAAAPRALDAPQPDVTGWGRAPATKRPAHPVADPFSDGP